MAKIHPRAFFEDSIVAFDEANLSIASSAVLYGLSVYTVFPIYLTDDGDLLAFRLHDHFNRLIRSSKIIGIDTFKDTWDEPGFVVAVKKLVAANTITQNVFVRATVHVPELVKGTRSRGLNTTLSMFIYDAEAILPKTGARIKTGMWRRIPDNAIPSRAKVNGAYVNSVLAKQDALDSGYDDCLFLDENGHVCELSAANIFIVRDGVLITPGVSSDLLEGINRRTVIALADHLGLPCEQRNVDLTELYIADEAFACGTSAHFAPITEIDNRKIGDGKQGPITSKVQNLYGKIFYGEDPSFTHLVTKLN